MQIYTAIISSERLPFGHRLFINFKRRRGMEAGNHYQAGLLLYSLTEIMDVVRAFDIYYRLTELFL